MKRIATFTPTTSTDGCRVGWATLRKLNHHVVVKTLAVEVDASKLLLLPTQDLEPGAVGELQVWLRDQYDTVHRCWQPS